MVKSFIMQLLAFFAIVGLAYSTEKSVSDHQLSPQGKHPLWADEGRLGQYQDAWKSLNQSNATLYYLVKATYQNDSASWGTMFHCLTVTETDRNETAKTVSSNFTFRNATEDGNKTFTVTEKVEAVKLYNYTNYTNAINYTLANGTHLVDPVVFSDGKTCDIIYAPYADNGTGGYELWVNSDYIDKIPSCCEFLLYFFAGNNRTVYNIYTKEKCESAHIKPEEVEKEK